MSTIPALTKKNPGELVTADEWNAMRQAVIALAQMVSEFQENLVDTVAEAVGQASIEGITPQQIVTDVIAELDADNIYAPGSLSAAVDGLTATTAAHTTSIAALQLTVNAIPTTYEKKLKRVQGTGTMTLSADELGVRY